MSYVLGIDTSSTELGVGLADNDRVIAGVSRYLRNSHAEHISRMIDYLLSSCNVKPLEVDFAAIAVGPGSFTGLRIGISFLKGFCFGRSVGVLALSSLESMATALCDFRRPIVAVFDGRNGQVFWARFVPMGNALVRASEDALGTFDDVEKTIDENDIVVADTLGNAKSPLLDFADGNPNVFLVERRPVQRGLTCACIGMKAIKDTGRWTACSEIAPRYLNVTSMERKLPCTP